jgi:hypothetical protein
MVRHFVSTNVDTVKSVAASQITSSVTENSRYFRLNPLIEREPLQPGETYVLSRIDVSSWDDKRVTDSLYYWVRPEPEGSTNNSVDPPADALALAVSAPAARTESPLDDDRFRTALPDGTTIELLGVSTHPSIPTGWWRPDGTLLADAPANSQGFRVAPQEGCRTLEFAIRARNDNSPGFGFTWKVTPSAGGSAQNASRDGRGTEVTGVGAANVPLDAASATISVGIASGQWHTWATTSKGARVDATTYAGSGVVLSGPVQSGEGIVVTSSDDVPGVVERRIVAIDKSGQIRAAASPQRTRVGKPMMNSVTFANLALDDVKEFQFQVRPFEFIEFKNVLLAPRPGASPIAASAPQPPTPPVAPTAISEPIFPSPDAPFRATLPDGPTVRVVGVSRHTSRASYPPEYTGDWWSPDGSPLAEPPCDPSIDNDAHPAGTKGRAFAVEVDANAGNVSVIGEIVPAQAGASGPAVRDGAAIAGLYKISGLIPDDAADVTLRVGVACGPWQRHGTSPSSLKPGDASFSAPLESEGRVLITVTDHLEGNLQRMVAAVDTSGRSHAPSSMQESISGNNHTTSATFDGLHLGDIKSFSFETRPYQYVEFKGIALDPRSPTASYGTALRLPEPPRLAAPPRAAQPLRTPPAPRTAAARQPARSKSPGAQSVTGTVLDESGQPVSGAEVAAYEFSSSPNPAVTAKTAADGSFSLRLRLPAQASEWILVARGDGALAFQKVQLRSDGIARRRIYAAEGGGVTVTTEKDPDPKPLEIRLAPADGRIAGIVSDADGAGLQDAEVRVALLAILPPVDAAWKDSSLPADQYESARVEYFPLEYIPALRSSFVALTHADGGFLIAGLPRGFTAHLSVTSPGLVPTNLDALILRPGTMNASIAMQQTGRIAGRLERPDTSTNAETRVAITGIASPYYEANTQVSWESPEFSFEDLPPGTYSLDANGWRDFVPVPVKNIPVEPGRTADVTVRFVKGSHVVGRFVDSQSGEGVASMSFRIGSKNGSSVPKLYASDAYGRFDIVLAPGAYSLFIDPTAAGATARGQGVAPAKPTEPPAAPISVTVEPGKYSRLGAIKLVPEGAAPPKPADPAASAPPAETPSTSSTAPQPPQPQVAQSAPLTGTLLDENGSPASNIEVTAYRGHAAGAAAPVTVRTTGDGEFTVTPFSSGTTLLVARPEGRVAFARLAPGQVSPVTMRLVPADSTISGTVVDSNNEPLSQVAVTASNIFPPRKEEDSSAINLFIDLNSHYPLSDYSSFENPYTASTDDDGRFEISGLPANYAAEISFFLTGYADLKKYFPAQSLDKVVTLPVEARLRGRLAAADPRAKLGGIWVDVNPGGEYSAMTKRVQTADDGSFAANGLPPGVAGIEPQTRSSFDWTFVEPFKVQLTEGKTANATFELVRAVRVTGRIRFSSAGAAPMAGVIIDRKANGGASVYGYPRRNTLATEGVYSATLPPGTYEIYPQYWDEKGDLFEVPGLTRVFTVNAGEEVTLPDFEISLGEAPSSTSANPSDAAPAEHAEPAAAAPAPPARR